MLTKYACLQNINVYATGFRLCDQTTCMQTLEVLNNLLIYINMLVNIQKTLCILRNFDMHIY